jgi:hypothetical protein
MLPGPDLLYECPDCGNRIKSRSIGSGNTIGARFYSDGRMDAPMLPDMPDLIACLGCSGLLWLSKLQPIAEFYMYDYKKHKDNGSDEKLWNGAQDASPLDIIDEFDIFGYNEHQANGSDEKLWIGAQDARPLDIKESKNALARIKKEYTAEEYFIRKKLWWMYNELIIDRTRSEVDGAEHSEWKRSAPHERLDKEDVDFYVANCEALITLTENRLRSYRLIASGPKDRTYDQEVEELFSEEIHQEIFTLCELHRNLGQFVQAEGVLEGVSEEHYADLVDQFRAVIASKDQFTFLIVHGS